jgi:hypothetical protein
VSKRREEEEVGERALFDTILFEMLMKNVIQVKECGRPGASTASLPLRVKTRQKM